MTVIDVYVANGQYAVRYNSSELVHAAVINAYEGTYSIWLLCNGAEAFDHTCVERIEEVAPVNCIGCIAVMV